MWAQPNPTTRAAWSLRRHTSRLSIPFLEAPAAPPSMGPQGLKPFLLLCPGQFMLTFMMKGHP